MAVDLRAIVAAVKINTDLERVGDLAVNIAEAARRYVAHPPVKKLIDIPRMATIAQSMLRDALDAFVRRDIELAQHVLNEDDALDALKTQIFRELLTYMLSGSGDHRAGARPDPGVAPSRAHRRPRHQRRRGRHLHGLGARRPAPRRREARTGDSGRRSGGCLRAVGARRDLTLDLRRCASGRSPSVESAWRPVCSERANPDLRICGRRTAPSAGPPGCAAPMAGTDDSDWGRRRPRQAVGIAAERRGDVCIPRASVDRSRHEP